MHHARVEFYVYKSRYHFSFDIGIPLPPSLISMSMLRPNALAWLLALFSTGAQSQNTTTGRTSTLSPALSHLGARIDLA